MAARVHWDHGRHNWYYSGGNDNWLAGREASEVLVLRLGYTKGGFAHGKKGLLPGEVVLEMA